jgi:cell division protein FtsI (penicillin-binding protein 3)
LEDVSKVGTAKAYFGEKVCPFTSGSKTGTAQVESEINKVNYKRSDGYYYGSMVTYFPADKPRYTIITAIFTKKQVGKQYYGAGLAGPVQKHIATYLYNRDHHYAQEVTSSKYTASDIKSGNISKIQTVANKHGVAISSQNNEGWGTNITSKSGKSIHISPLKIETNVVPNVIGMGLNDALFILEKSGLNVKVIGKGKVVSQSVAPNTGLTEDTEGITIRLE